MDVISNTCKKIFESFDLCPYIKPRNKKIFRKIKRKKYFLYWKYKAYSNNDKENKNINKDY